MFDFEKLNVYQKASIFNCAIYSFLSQYKNIDKAYRDQLRRASFSIPLNIAEGSGRFSKADKKHFYIIAIGSAFECVAILDQLKRMQLISEETYNEKHVMAFEMTNMLFGLQKSLS